MTKTESIEAVALEHLRRAEYGEGKEVLLAALNREPTRTDLMRLINMLDMGMVAEAIDGLRRKVLLMVVLILVGLFLSPANASAEVKLDGKSGAATHGARQLTAAVTFQPLPSQTKAEAYLWALGELESGNNDQAQGKAGEVGRYQCLKLVLVCAGGVQKSEFRSLTNAATAAAITLRIIRQRTAKAIADLSPEQFAVAWHCPARLRGGRWTAEQRDYVKRFETLAGNFNHETH